MLRHGVGARLLWESRRQVSNPSWEGFEEVEWLVNEYFSDI